MPSGMKYLNQPMATFLDQAIKAVTDNMPASAKVTIKGVNYTKPQLVTKLESLKAPYDAVAKAHAQVDDTIKTRDEAEPDAVSFAKSYSTVLVETFGDGAQVATQYAIPTPRPRRQLTVQEKVAARAKAAATRKKRGTLGKRQKEKIKATGDFSVTVGAQDGSDPVNNTSTPVATSPSTPSLPTTVSTAQPAPATPGSATASNGVVAPMLMNGSGH